MTAYAVYERELVERLWVYIGVSHCCYPALSGYPRTPNGRFPDADETMRIAR